MGKVVCKMRNLIFCGDGTPYTRSLYDVSNRNVVTVTSVAYNYLIF